MASVPSHKVVFWGLFSLAHNLTLGDSLELRATGNERGPVAGVSHSSINQGSEWSAVEVRWRCLCTAWAQEQERSSYHRTPKAVLPGGPCTHLC